VTRDVAADDGQAPGGVAQRIGRFLRGLERARRQPNRREAYHLQVALEGLRTKQLSDSEAAMENAERCAPLPAHVASLVTTNNPLTVAQLQQKLDEIMTDQP
jgi:hypothetical protein